VSPFSWKDLEDLVEDWTKVEIEQAIGFVKNHVLQMLQRETLGVFKMIEQTAYSLLA
jgi:hypothetical protein